MSRGPKSNIYIIVVPVCKLKSAKSRVIPSFADPLSKGDVSFFFGQSKGDVSLTCSLIFPLGMYLALWPASSSTREKKKSAVMMKLKLVTLMNYWFYIPIFHSLLIQS